MTEDQSFTVRAFDGARWIEHSLTHSEEKALDLYRLLQEYVFCSEDYDEHPAFLLIQVFNLREGLVTRMCVNTGKGYKNVPTPTFPHCM